MQVLSKRKKLKMAKLGGYCGFYKNLVRINKALLKYFVTSLKHVGWTFIVKCLGRICCVALYQF